MTVKDHPRRRVSHDSRSAARELIPPPGAVDFGQLRRGTPVSRVFGFDRGCCIDRYYIHRFLSAHAADIRGRVLEVAENNYTHIYGGDRVTQSDVLHVAPGHRRATIVDDLTSGATMPDDIFDCVILTQTLQHIFDTRAVLRTVHRILRPGGVALVTVPGISQISRYDMDRWGDFWRFTTLSLQRLFEEVFAAESLDVQAHGNVLAAVAFLHGLSADELRDEELDAFDPDYQLLLTVRAEKSAPENL